MKRALIIALIATACSDLSDIDRNTCGNGVLEPGEDCDASDMRCVACGIRCDAGEGADGNTQCAEYPGAAGFVCGADAFCHAPSGRFRPPTELSTSIETLRATDVDHDGYGDVLVQSATAVRVLFGNADGHPTTSQQVLTPIARGPASYADLDADGKLDIMLPASDGIVAYTSPYDVLSPFPFPSIVSTASEGRPYYSNQIAPGFIGFVGVMPGAQSPAQAYYFVRDVGDDVPMPFIAVTPLCTATDQSFDPHAVSVFDVRQDYQLLAASYRQAGQMKLCVIAIERVAGNYTLTNLTVNFGATRTPASRAVLAPIGASACPSIVVREQIGANPGDVIALAGVGTTSCNYSGAPSVRTLSSTGGDPIGWARLTPPDPGTNATVALALSNAVFAVPAAGPLTKLLYIADRPLAAIDSADFDNDGDVDIVAISTTAAGEPVEDIDLLSRIAAGFVRYRVDTDGPADLLTIGDYDGNGIRDVAYVQTRVNSGVNRYDLMIAYATTDKLLPGVSVGTYGKIISLIVGEIPDSNDPFSVVGDLVVLFEDFGQTAITLLHGSPQRTMLGFFDPRAGQPVPTIFRGAVAGQFNDAAGPAGLDLIAIDDGGAGGPNLWRSNGPTGSQVMAMTPFTVPLMSDCNRPGPTTNLCIDGAIHVAWPTSPTTDRVISFGLDSSGDARVITFDPHAETPSLPASAWPAIAELPAKARVRNAEVVVAHDLPQLVVSYTLPEPHVLLCDIEASGLPAQCTDVGAQLSQQLGDLVCTHVTSARFAPVTRFMDKPPIANQLVALCHPKATPDAATLYALDVDLRASELMFAGRGQELRVGDIDGNGVDDFLIVDRGGQVPTLRIFRQCTSREVQTCGL